MKNAIRMWNTGELSRRFEHVKLSNGKRTDAPVECMVIRRPLDQAAEPVVIELRNMHFYYPRDQREMLEAAIVVTQFMVHHLHLPVDEVSVRRFIDYIQDGFDELKKMKPPEVQQKVAIGEYSGTIDGERISGEVKE